MKIKFFEWSDFENHILEKYNISLPKNSETINEKFSLEKAKDYEVISIKTFSRISNQDLKELKKNKCHTIALRTSGFNMLDTEFADKLGFNLFRVAAYSPESIAEYAIAMILFLARKMSIQRNQHINMVNGRFLNSMGFILKGKTLGLHGYGRIARELARIAKQGFQMKVQFFDPYYKKESQDNKIKNLKKLYSSSDIVSIHVPLTKETKGIVNKNLLSNVKKNFMLINTARGAIINTEDIKELFDQGIIDYLGVDVWNENDKFDKDLLKNNAFQSYHVAFFTEEAVKAMIEQTLESIQGNPKKENILPIVY